jgi:PAS domain S-box-containing protein
MTPACEILYVSPAVRRQLGYEPKELLGKIIFDPIYEPDRSIARAAAAKSAEPGVDNAPGTQRWMHKDGHLVWIEVNGRMVRDKNGQPNEIILITRDISDRKALEEQLEQLATTDALTGLRNRRGFDEVCVPYNVSILTICSRNADALARRASAFRRASSYCG